MSEEFFRSLAREAAARYPPRLARQFAFGKLTADPVFRHLLESGLLGRGARVLDLGSGKGLLAALLVAARERHAAGRWPADWPAPPDPASITGVELSEREVERARAAAQGTAEFIAGDIRTVEFGTAEVVVILDVLHYIDYDAQESVLRRVRRALEHGGVLLLRVGDASPALRFRVSVAVDRLDLYFRGRRPARLWCRPVAAWTQLLSDLGFAVAPTPMSAGTPFANVLLVARYDAP